MVNVFLAKNAACHSRTTRNSGLIWIEVNITYCPKTRWYLVFTWLGFRSWKFPRFWWTWNIPIFGQWHAYDDSKTWGKRHENGTKEIKHPETWTSPTSCICCTKSWRSCHVWHRKWWHLLWMWKEICASRTFQVSISRYFCHVCWKTMLNFISSFLQCLSVLYKMSIFLLLLKSLKHSRSTLSWSKNASIYSWSSFNVTKWSVLRLWFLNQIWKQDGYVRTQIHWFEAKHL